MPNPLPRRPKVVSARSHIGVQVGAAVFNSIIRGKNDIESLELTPWGLHIIAGSRSYVIPFANIQSIEVEKDNG